MIKIDGFISDKKISEKYLIFDTTGQLGFWYSSDINSGTGVKVYLRELPNFEDVYHYFMSCRFWGLKFNKKQDICLSLFYMPYFTEFYDRIKKDIKEIPKNRLNVLKKFLIEYLSSKINYKYIVEDDMLTDKSTKKYYIEKDIYMKSKELLELFSNILDY